MKTKLQILLLLICLTTLLAGIWHGYRQAQAPSDEAVWLEDEVVPYQRYFQEYAPEIGWEWEMLAAVAYHESRFKPHIVSYSGAQGIMQLMPKTGRRFGLNDSTFFVPKDNIAASVKYIAYLQRQFYFISDSVEQVKFILSSYNAGPAHIYDARRLARKYGSNPYLWNDVEYYLERLDEEEYYNDSIVQYGYFNPTQTIRYVHGVLRTYKKYKTIEQAKKDI